MNERQEQTADVLGKLTVLGTIVLPLNIIGSLWGMNVKVPGQDVDNLHWFYSSMFFSLSLWGHCLWYFLWYGHANGSSHGGSAALCHRFVLHCEACIQYCLGGSFLSDKRRYDGLDTLFPCLLLFLVLCFFCSCIESLLGCTGTADCTLYGVCCFV